ncbi:unnamed protein product [Microthlaspi erraticum]|uniref:Retrotransposon gag domain-containing protein n=1 Tax=Microthlaspi erraticum TaxID=1685480 RepID=A0A6D2I1J3_9BRAS|nr:unnamed protein product [Microthlaspi erraticum]
MKLKEFNAKVKSLPFYVTFEEAWDKHGLVEFFFTTSENKEEIHQLFRKARFPIAPHGVNQPPSPPSSPPPSGMSIPYQERSLLSSISLSKLFQPACLSNKLGATTHSPPSSTTAKRTPEDIRELFEKAKVQPTFKTLYKIEDPGQFSIPCQVNGHYFDRTLCDSGSCINLMPTQTAKLLGITRLTYGDFFDCLPLISDVYLGLLAQVVINGRKMDLLQAWVIKTVERIISLRLLFKVFCKILLL